MLELFIKECPDELDFIMDVDKYFNSKHLRDDEYTHRVLREVEHAEMIDESTFKDRTGVGLKIDYLSTSTKCLLLLKYYPDIIINCDEIGYNALQFVESGKIYFSTTDRELPSGLKVFYKGDEYDSDDLNYMLSLEV